jgi:hypothetical protein
VPNWIINRLVVKGDPERIREFLQAVKSGRQPLDFQRIIPSPELIRRARQVFSPIGPPSQSQYFIDDMHWRDFTPDEEKELEALGYRSWGDWSFANWGANKIAFEVELDESTVDLGYVVITFETAWSPPVRILERLRAIFPDLAFCCEWFPEDGSFDYGDYPDPATAIARSEEEQHGEHLITTLYLQKAAHPAFFLHTQTTEPRDEHAGWRSIIKPMTREEAHAWLLAPDVELLTLLYPALGKPETEADGGDETSTPTLDGPAAKPDDGKHLDDLPL